eukprot:5383595-Karenia_brevis.AAC.1
MLEAVGFEVTSGQSHDTGDQPAGTAGIGMGQSLAEMPEAGFAVTSGQSHDTGGKPAGTAGTGAQCPP